MSIRAAGVLCGVLACLGPAAGCGSSDGSSGGSTGAATGSAPAHTASVRTPSAAAESSLYRWLVPTEGAPPSIAVENRARGTGSWRLPGPGYELGGEARGAIAGYVAQQAIAP
ncbi:MAG TPA: hypothetical protein VED41_08405, partial [Solirubrobacteraceae bacterium]|nr:hypothetical protein [Solirubrobacteraceae bacterium]